MDNLSRYHGAESDLPASRAAASAPFSQSAALADSQTGTWEYITQQEPDHPAGASVRNVVKELLETAIYILLIFVIVRSMVQNFKIEGSSMEPSMHNGQYILVNKLGYFHFDLHAPLRLLPGYEDLPPRMVAPLGPPRRGDIVVFEYPNDRTKDYIKRVIGLPGETVTIKDGLVYINGDLLAEPYLQGYKTYCETSFSCANEQPVEVPPSTVFVLGDHRTNSSDSRQWGPLSFEYIIGQAWILYYPFDDLGVVPVPSYASDAAE